MNLSTYDAFDEEARDLYWEQCERELFAAGTDAWWCDSTEPFTPDWNGAVKRPDETRYQMAKDSTDQYLDARESNLFALKHAQGIYEHKGQYVPKREWRILPDPDLLVRSVMEPSSGPAILRQPGTC